MTASTSLAPAFAQPTLSFDSKDKVNEVVDSAITAGGTEAREPQDYGFMYGRSFNDLDGHIWEIIWMDPSHIQRS